MSNVKKTASQLIFDDLMENVKIIYGKDSFSYAKTDDIEAYFEKQEALTHTRSGVQKNYTKQ